MVKQGTTAHVHGIWECYGWARDWTTALVLMLREGPMRHVRLVILLAVLVVLSGCGVFREYVFVRPLQPTIQPIQRPELPAVTPEELASLPQGVQDRLAQRDTLLKDVIRRYEDVIRRYNEWAAEQNSGYNTPEFRADVPTE